MAIDVLSMLFVVLYFAFPVAVAQPTSIVCVAGQCLQGYSDTAIGATVSGSGITQRVLLLPGQYTTTTNPQFLHNILTSHANLVGSIGFESARLSSLPLNITLEPGVAIYSQPLYSGQASFAKLPESPIASSSIPLPGKSFAIAPGLWIAISNNNRRIILWDSVPDISQLPATGSLSLLDVQSSRCSPPCASTSVCSAAGTCICPTGFNGSACESCEDGFFGPTCQPCPDGCSNCDQGMSGSGRCLSEPDNLPSSCDCLNGICSSDGQCTCNNGWTTDDNGTACAMCLPGFFLSTTGDCQACSPGCDRCTDLTGNCVTCLAGFTQDLSDRTRCSGIVTTITSPNEPSMSIVCPGGTYGQGSECVRCNPFCITCKGPTTMNCTLCMGGLYFSNGGCRLANLDGVCHGTNGLVANRKTSTCDPCGPKCTSCKIPNFYQRPTSEVQCTDCLPGFFLFEGKCVADCPTGMFAPQDDNVCTNCSSSCSTCAGSPDFCLTCPDGQFASSGKCISTCPTNSFSSPGSCTQCHPDCATCSGATFDQCTSCPSSLPVLSGGRCLSTCSQSQYLDPATSTCQACDSSCSSCSGPGSRNCLGCSSSVSSQVLRGGSCVPADCQDVVPGLGVCLSELVKVSSSLPSATPVSGLPMPLPSESGSPLPTVPGLTDPTKPTSSAKPTWWQIFLMTLGGVFLLLVVIWCWRKWARRHREKKTKNFAQEKNLDGWWVRLAQRLFRGKKTDLYAPESIHSPKIQPIDDDLIFRRLAPPKSIAKEQSTSKRDSIDDFISSYAISPPDSRRKNGNPRRFKNRIDQNSHSLHSGGQSSPRRPAVARPRDPVLTPSRRVPLNREGPLLDNRLNPQADIRANRPAIVGDTGVSYTNHQSTLSRFPNAYARPSGLTPGAVEQYPGGNRMPVTLPNNGRFRGAYALPPGQTMQPLQVPQPPMSMTAPYPYVSPRNPFRNAAP